MKTTGPGSLGVWPAMRGGAAWFSVACLALVALCLAGCHADAEAERPESELVVFAAASLESAFRILGQRFEKAHAGVHVRMSFAGTQTLRVQLEHGAPTDVFASADRVHMQALFWGHRVERPVLFAENEPVLVVAPDRSSTLNALSALPRADRIALGAANVPIGRYSLEILDRATVLYGADFRSRVEAKIVSRELSVRQVLAKVTLGEADAAIVYLTDARSAQGKVTVVPLPRSINLTVQYPVAMVTGAAHPRLAQSFIELLLSREGRAVLAEAGFREPAVGAP